MKPMSSLVASACLLLVCALKAQEPKSAPVPPGAKPAASSSFKNIGVDEFDKLRAEKKSVVLDVRTPKEFAAGHIPGATNIDWYASDFEQKISALDKSKTYLVHCAAGRRGAKACEKMGKLDFPKLCNLEGGFTAWEKAGKPVER